MKTHRIGPAWVIRTGVRPQNWQIASVLHFEEEVVQNLQRSQRKVEIQIDQFAFIDCERLLNVIRITLFWRKKKEFR